MTDDHIHDDDMLAAEYVLRLLGGDDLKAAETRLDYDPAFAQRVASWEFQLAQLAEYVPSEQPRPASKKALFATLFPEKAQPSFWQRVGVWQMLSAVSVVGALAFGIAFMNGAGGTSGPLYTAEIAAAAGDFRVIAVVDKTRNEVILTKTRGAAPAGRILQVWAHGPGELAMSVGLWPEGESVRLDLPPTIAAVNGVLTLGVSEEPIGGSMTGLPSGRIFGTVDIPDVTSAL